MNDHLDLDDRLRDLAAAVPPPTTPVEQDVERGRRRLRRTRWLVSGGAAAGVAVVALGVGLAGTLADDGPSTSPAPATQKASDKPNPKPKRKVDRRDGAELLRDYRDVLADHLDPTGTHLQKKPDNLQSGDGLGTKLGWTIPGQDGLGMVEIFVGKSWWSFIGADCNGGADCSRTTVDGVEAQVIRWDGQTTVVVKRPDTTVAITVDALFGNNSLVPVEGIDIPVDELVRAAADPRLTQATAEQVESASSSMFPDLYPELDLPIGEPYSTSIPLPDAKK